MSLEYPPTAITTANTWKKDLYDRYPAHSAVSYDDANGTLMTVKTVVTGSPYGNGEYKAFGNSWYSYSESSTWSTSEWPVNGPFEKSEGDSNTTKSWHTAGTSMSTTTDMSEPVVLGIEMPDHIKLTSYSMKNRPGFAVRSPKKWNLYGRRNCGTWTLIETRSVTSWSSGQTRSWNLSPSEYYSDYRFDFLTAYNSSLQIYTIKLYGIPEQMTTPIRFDRLGNLPFTRAAIYNKTTTSAITLERGLKDLADIEDTSVMSLDLLQDPTMYNGKFYVPDSGTHTEYFPSKFSTVPGVFFTLEWEVWGSGTGTRKNLVITEVTTEYFTITNPQSNMDPIVHWMAVKPGTGQIYGKNYECQVVSSGANWGSSRTFTYSNLGTNPFIMYCVNSRNNSSNVYYTHLNALPTSTQATLYTGINSDSDVRNNQTVSSSEQLAYFGIKNSGDVANKMYMWTGTEKSVSHSAHTTTTNGATLQNAICLGIVRNTGGNSLNLYANRLTNKRVKWYIKEEPGMDGSHGAETTLMLQMAGTTTRKAKPFWHLCANHLNAVQGVSVDSHVDRWYNLSQRAFKYAVGRAESGSHKPTLKSNSNGYFVDFNNANQEYFDIPCPVTWEFSDNDGSGTKGVTAFCVMKFINTSHSWPRFFDFGNGSGVDNILWAKNGSGQEIRFQLHDPTIQYDSTNDPATTNWTIYTMRYDNSNQTTTFWANNIPHGPTEQYTATSTDRTTTINYIGNSNWSGDAELHAHMREQIVYDDVLTADQINDIHIHLSEKWNITIPYSGTKTSAYSDLIAWYRCEETSGSTLADSIGGNHMTLHNSSHYTHNSDSVDQGSNCITFSRSSTAKAYDSSGLSYGVARLTDLGPINPQNAYSISMWVKFTQSSYHGTMWQFNHPTHYATFHRLSYIVDGGGYWHFQSDYKQTSSSTRYVDALSTPSGAVSYNNNVWHHLVITKSGNSSSDVCKLYINGSLATSLTLTNSGGKTWGLTNLTFGTGWHYNKWNWWSKDMKTDDYRIYNKELSSSEVTELYATK